MFNVVKVEDMQLVDGSLKIQIAKYRKRHDAQKFKLINRLHNDKIKTNIFDKVLDKSDRFNLSIKNG